MTNHDEDPGLFWLALILVALVFGYFAARKLFVARSPRRPWLIIVLLAMGPAADALDRARLTIPQPWRSEGTAGWSSPYMPAAGHPYQSRHARQRV